MISGQRRSSSVLPKITKDTDLKKFEVDLSLIREDPIFGEFRKNNMPSRLTPIDFKSLKLTDILVTNRHRNSTMEN